MTSPYSIERGYGGLARPGGAARGDSLADLLERVLDKGVVIAGDVAVNLLDIELLTLKVRLLIASADTARAMGIDWWESDPFLSSRARKELESSGQRQIDGGSSSAADRGAEERLAALEADNAELRRRLDRVLAALESPSREPASAAGFPDAAARSGDRPTPSGGDSSSDAPEEP
jgi:hypothetical protein